MESKPTDQLAGMAQGVHWLLRQFDALGADMTPPPAAAARPSDAGPIEVSYLVAALDERPELRAVADFICGATDANVEIDAALAALGSTLGRIVLSGASFNVADNWVLTIPATCTMAGVGTPSTWIIPAGDIQVDVYGVLDNIKVEGEGC